MLSWSPRKKKHTNSFFKLYGFILRHLRFPIGILIIISEAPLEQSTRKFGYLSICEILVVK